MSSTEGGELKSRETWTNKVDFLFATIGFGVGFGNVWRFPYVCYRNGGGVFLIPYLISVLCIGIPMVFMEVALGQFMSSGAMTAWKLTPLFQGIGFAQGVIVFFCNLYYTVILAWVLYYLFSSFTLDLPWASCNNSWNTPNCIENQWQNGSVNSSRDMDILDNETTAKTMDPATEYWEHKVLGISAGVEFAGVVKWDLALCLLLAWVMVYLCIWRGIKLSVKISYVTVTAPYLLFVILLVRGVTLPGAVNGIKFFVLPDWSKLGDAQVWIEAAIQVFYSYAPGTAMHTSLGSCNKFRHNSLKHVLIFAVVNSGTSLLSGFVIFSVLGFMADKYNVSVADVAGSGPGLAFVAYPEAVAQMPIAPLWSCLFFLLLFIVGIDSQFVQAEAFMVAMGDIFPKLFRRSPKKQISIGVICLIWYLLGLSMVTQGGVYVEQIIEWYCAGRLLMLIAVLECFAISYIYGINRFLRNLEYMLEFRLLPYFKICWSVVTPLVSICLFVVDIVLYPEFTYKRKSGVYYFPGWSRAIGWMLGCSAVVWIPGYMVYRLLTTPGSLLQRFRVLMSPEFNDVQASRDRGVRGTNCDPEEVGRNDTEMVQMVS